MQAACAHACACRPQATPYAYLDASRSRRDARARGMCVFMLTHIYGTGRRRRGWPAWRQRRAPRGLSMCIGLICRCPWRRRQCICPCGIYMHRNTKMFNYVPAFNPSAPARTYVRTRHGARMSICMANINLTMWLMRRCGSEFVWNCMRPWARAWCVLPLVCL